MAATTYKAAEPVPSYVFSQLKYGIAKLLELRPKINATHGRVGACQQHAF
jgi:hypothetical protein